MRQHGKPSIQVRSVAHCSTFYILSFLAAAASALVTARSAC